MNQPISDLRQNYTVGALNEADVSPDPITQFGVWFDAARATPIIEPNAMTLATVTPDGKPSARMVLLKGFDQRGFVFYTNSRSRKGDELDVHPWATLVFWWDVLQRQVRIEGSVEKTSAADADAYFASRPRGSQLGAWASEQSKVIADREVVEKRLAALEQQYTAGGVPRPPYWGGYRVVPQMIEFWQGRPSRLHDRLRYRLVDGNWVIERLAP